MTLQSSSSQPPLSASIPPGLALSAVVAAAAYGIHYLPITPFQVGAGLDVRHPISAAIIAVLVGVLVSNLLTLPPSVTPGCKKIVKNAIPFAIILIGAGLDLNRLTSLGASVLVITLLCMALAIAGAYLIGRFLGLGHKLSLLLGAGTGICGNSAIVAVAPLIDAEDDDLVLSIGTVNLFGLVAMLACPLLAGVMAMGYEAYGVWAGTTIHAVPQVVAAGLAHSPDAGTLATAVKMLRVALLAPLVFIFAIVGARTRSAGQGGHRPSGVNYLRLVPWFVWGFALMAMLGTIGAIPTIRVGEADVSLVQTLTTIGKILLTLAMAAIGLEVKVRELAGVGRRAVIAGLASTIVLAAVSLGLIMLLVGF